MTQNFTIQSSVAIDTTTARAELARLSQDYEALRQRIMQPIPVNLNAPPMLAVPQTAFAPAVPQTAATSVPAIGRSAAFQLDTAEAHRRLSQLSQDYENLRQRILQPVAVNLTVPQGLQNTGGQQNGQQGAPVAIDTTQAQQALAQLGQDYDALRQRMMQPIPVTVNTGGAGNGGAPAHVSGGGSSPGGSGFFGGIWTGVRRVWSAVNFAWSGVKFLIGGVGSFFSMIGRGITSLATTPFRLLTSAINGVATAFGHVRTVAQSVMSLLQPAGDLQQRSFNMEVLLKDRGKASARLEELERYAKETNFNPGEVIEASNLMQAFGIHGNDLTRLKLAGDAANAFGKDIREVVTSLNYLGSGRGGEAFESLARIGVTREKLKPYGVEFNRQGVLLTDAKKAIKAVFKYFEDTFGGATKRQATTWKGALQQASGEVTYALSHGLMGALKPFTAFVSKSIIPAISRIGGSLKKIDWEKTLAKPLGTLKKIVDTVSSMGSRAIDPRTRGNMFAELKILGTGLLESGRLVAGGLMKVGKGLLMDLGATLENFTKNGVFPALASTFWNMGKTVLFGFLDAGRLVLSGFSDKFKSDLLMAIETLPIPGIGNNETVARMNAERTAKKAVIDDVAKGHYGAELQLFYRQQKGRLDRTQLQRERKAAQKVLEREILNMTTSGRWNNETTERIYEQIGKANSTDEIVKLIKGIDAGMMKNSIVNKAINAVNSEHTGNKALELWKALGGASNPVLQEAYENKYARHMGWSDSSTKKFESKAAGALKDAEKSLKDTIGKASMSVSTKNTREQWGEAKEDFSRAARPFGSYFAHQQAQAALDVRFDEYEERANKRLAYIDKELDRHRKEYRRARRNDSSSDTLNGMDSVIQSLEAEKKRIKGFLERLGGQRAQASNNLSRRWQLSEIDREISELNTRAESVRETDTGEYKAIQTRISEKKRQREAVVSQQQMQRQQQQRKTVVLDAESQAKVRQNAARMSQLDTDVSGLNRQAVKVRDTSPEEYKKILNEIRGKQEEREELRLETRRIWQENAERQRRQQRPQQRPQQRQQQQQPRRPASPGMQQEGQPRQSREAASVGNIELNTASTAKNIFLLADAINRFLTRQNGLEKTLQQVLEA